MTVEIAARGIVTGSASGPALVSAEPISFLGDVDINTGRIVGDLPSVHGVSVRGTILIFPYTRGSAGAWRFLYQLYTHGNHPLALIIGKLPDPSVVQGAILAGIPIVCEPADDIAKRVRNGDQVSVDADRGVIRLAAATG